MMWLVVERLQKQLLGLLSSSSSQSRSQSTTTGKATSTPPPPCSDLYDLVLDLDWDRVIEHSTTNPHDAQFQDGDNLETPLYLACQWSPPLSVIRALIKANPSALKWTSREHYDLPIHMICRYPSTSIEILREFTLHSPASACHATKYGKTPIQILWEYSRPDCMKQQSEQLELSEEEQLEIQTFWSKMELLVEAVATSRQQQQQQDAAAGSAARQERGKAQAAQDQVENESTLSSPIQQQQQQQQKILYKVHAVVSLGFYGFPIEVLEYVCNKYPDQISQRDGTGQLPLHVAVGPTQWSGKRRYKPRNQSMIRLLLEKYPQGAHQKRYSAASSGSTTNPNDHHKVGGFGGGGGGRYPLHIAIANRHQWIGGGLQDLFRVAPHLLSVRDPITQLLPFQLAAIPVQQNLQVDITTIFSLLRQQPELVLLA